MGLCCATLLSTTSCTDEEVATSVGVIAIGVGAGLIIGANDNDNHHHHRGHYVCEGGYRYSCYSYRDYYGNYRRDCRDVYDSCASRRWEHYATPSNNVLASLPEDVSSVEWAKKFAMSPAKANKLISALKQAKTGKAQALNNLGLKKEDLRAIAKYEVPSQETVKVLAKNLNQLPKNTESMLSQLVLAAKKLK